MNNIYCFFNAYNLSEQFFFIKTRTNILFNFFEVEKRFLYFIFHPPRITTIYDNNKKGVDAVYTIFFTGSDIKTTQNKRKKL